LVTEINVTFPVVFTLKLVKVLLLMFCVSVAAELTMYVCTLVPAIEWVIPLMSLPVMVSADEEAPPILFIPISALVFAAL